MKNSVCFLIVVFQIYCTASAQVITTFAGTGLSGYSGDGGLATLAKMQSPSGVTVDRIGNVYFADQNGNRIRKINTSGIISTVAGIGGTGGYTGDGGLATLAKLYFPTGVAVDLNGNIYIADQFNNVIRNVDSFGIISTLAGNGTIGYSGDSGMATNARFWHPADVCVGINGDVYTVDQDNSAVRKITTSGYVYTIAGNGTSGFSGDGGAATSAKLNFPEGIAIDTIGNIYIADLYNNRVRKIDTSGVITTIAGNGTGGFSGDSSLATNAKLYYPSAVAIDSAGNLYIADATNNRIRKVSNSGIITTVAGTGISGTIGDGGLATEAEINYPEGVAVDRHGSIYIADYYN